MWPFEVNGRNGYCFPLDEGNKIFPRAVAKAKLLQSNKDKPVILKELFSKLYS